MKGKESNFISYLVKLILFSCIILLLIYAFEPAIPDKFQSGWVCYLVYFFALTTLMLHYIIIRLAGGNPKRFITYFMAATGIKLFVYLGVLLIFIFSFPEIAVAFIIEFFVLYLLYTSFETYFALKLKPHTNSSSQ